MAEHKPEPGESMAYDPKEPSAVRPALSRSPRRDPRADPDDDEPISSRVDVVSVDRRDRPSSVDSVTNAALTLRRELAKLHEQAAAVERTLEEQRRERSEALERIELAYARAEEAEHKLELADVEIANVRRLHDAALEDLQSVRAQRDDLAHAIEKAKEAAEELGRARAEAESLRTAHEAALKAASTFEAELAEVRKREEVGFQKVSDGEAEVKALRERIDRTNAELAQSREEAAQSKSEVVRLRQEAQTAAEAAAKKQTDLEAERRAANDEVERLTKSLTEARTAQEALTVAQNELTAQRAATAEARAEITRLERDLEAACHARDVSIERAAMAESETVTVRKDAERRKRELEAATNAAAAATSRATAAERARVVVEESVRQLRDEITNSFARWRTVNPSTPPPAENHHSAPPPTRVVSMSGSSSDRVTASPKPVTADAARLATISEPPLTKRGAEMAGQEPPAPVVEPEALPVSLLHDDWPSDSQPPANIASSTAHAANDSSSVSRSAPLPLPARAAVPRPNVRLSQIPAAVYPSLPPPAGSLPATSSPERPPSGIHILSEERDDLIELLGDAATARDAASELLARPDWLLGRPPVELLMALTQLDYDVESPVFELARAWEREHVCRALIAALRDEPEVKLREHGAWLLKHLSAPTAWAALAELVESESEPSAVRRWLLEALERLVATKNVGWSELRDLVGRMLRHDDSSLRDGAVGIVSALERSDDKRRILLEVLAADDDEVVLASAVQALASVLPVVLDTAVTERLLGHPSARVQRSVADFIERSRRAAKA